MSEGDLAKWGHAVAWVQSLVQNEPLKPHTVTRGCLSAVFILSYKHLLNARRRICCRKKPNIFVGNDLCVHTSKDIP